MSFIIQLKETQTQMNFDSNFNIINEDFNDYDSFDNLLSDSPNIDFSQDTSQWTLRDGSYYQVDQMEQQEHHSQRFIQIESHSQSIQIQQIASETYGEDPPITSQDEQEEYIIQKSKKICKVQKTKIKKEKKEKRQVKKEKKVKNSFKKAADCNNFGKLLIGTVVDNIILAEQIVQNNSFKIFFNNEQKVINLEDSSLNLQIVLQIIQTLKMIANKIPRKNGDRKNLNPIFNISDQYYLYFKWFNELNLTQNELKAHVETAKHILRQELLFIFSQNKWIQNHSNKKQFKTDIEEKRLNYQKYLQNVRDCLKKQKGFAKRIDSKYEIQSEILSE